MYAYSDFSTLSSSAMTLHADSPPPPLESVSTATVNGAATSEDSAPGPSSPSSSPPPSFPTLPQELGIPISWPQDGNLSMDWVHNLMACFDWSSRNLPPSEFPSVLPVHVFDSLVLIASKMLHKEPNCVPVEPFRPSPDSSAAVVVVVGDVHGQLHDLLFLIRDAGYPSQDRIFVFNGDYVDRGAWGLETFLILLAWKVTPCKLWRQVGESFRPPKTCTTVSWTLWGFYEKALLDYERHKTKGVELNVPITSHSEPMNIENQSLLSDKCIQASASGRARRDAVVRAMQGWHSQLSLTMMN